MIKSLINRIRGKSAPAKLRRTVISRDQHTISRKNISHAALKTLYRLREHGYEAYLVGGGVRDLLLGLHPKDFDITTAATPEQVKQLFGGQCQLIGRRFRLAHVRYGREVIEVATFRAHHSQSDNGQQARLSDEGMILRDNVWGTVEDDAERRDFTVNALYYTIDDFSVLDFTGGLQDLEKKQLRLIGDPDTRYREDPVRMLRAVRLAAKLNFTIEAKTAAPIIPLAKLLDDISSHRLFDESQKILSSGYAERALALLEEYQLFSHLFPFTPLPESRLLLQLTAQSTDQRIADDRSVNPAFFFAALLWPAVEKEYQRLLAHGEPPVPALQQAGQKAIQRQIQRTAITRFTAQAMREIWEMQPRLTNPRSRQVEALVQQGRFRAAYDFLVLRERAGENTHNFGEWWTRYQDADPGLKAEMLRALDKDSSKAPGKKRRRPPRKKPAGTPAP